MQVYIVGSMRRPEKKLTQEQERDFENRQKLFRSACQALGWAFAKRNHEIIVGVTSWEMLRGRYSVATFVVEGISQETSKPDTKHTVVFYVPRDREPPDTTKHIVDSMAEINNYTNIDLHERVLPGRSERTARAIPRIEDVDAVVLVGGSDGTASIGYAAFAMGKPCIAVTSLGGAAQELFEDILFDEHKRFVNPWLGLPPRITESDLLTARVDWCDKDKTGKETETTEDKTQKNRECANKIVSLTENLVHATNRSKLVPRIMLGSTLTMMVILLVAWVLLYIEFPKYLELKPFIRPVTFFLLLYCSALLGAGLRLLSLYRDDTSAQMTFSRLSLEAVLALLVAYGLALLNLIGGVSITGQVVVLDQTADISFNTICVTWSLIGLAAGYLLPVDQLRERLGKEILDKEK